MTLISALLGIVVDRLLTQLHEYRQYHYFLQYIDWARSYLNASFWDGPAGLLLTLLPVWVAVGLLQIWIGGWVFGLAGLLFYVLVLVYCLGPRDLAVDVATYCEVADSSDAALRARATVRLLGDENPSSDPVELTRRVAAAVLTESADRLFAVLFWFVLLGPLGAVMFRSAAVLYDQRREQDQFGASSVDLYAVLLWLPARLLALSLALSGHFDSALEGWRQAHQTQPEGVDGSQRVVSLTGAGALGLQDADFEAAGAAPVRAAMRLVWRSLAVWLVVLSLLVLAGWAR